MTSSTRTALPRSSPPLCTACSAAGPCRSSDLRAPSVRPFLGAGLPALAHLLGEVAHEVTDRHTEPLALDDRPDEAVHRRGVATLEHVLQSLGHRGAQALLLKHEAQHLAERSVHAV